MFKRGRKSPGRNGLTAFIDQGSEIEGGYTLRVTLKRTARMFGDVEAPIIIVEEGVLFEGHCRMTKVNQIAEVSAGRDLSVVSLKR